MKRKLLIIAILVITVVASASVLGTAARDAKIKLHKSSCDLMRSAIEAGYLACRLGIPLTNYLADVDAAWDKQLAERITEESKQPN